MRKPYPLIGDVLFSEEGMKLHSGLIRLEREGSFLVTPVLNELTRLASNRSGNFWRNDINAAKDSWKRNL